MLLKCSFAGSTQAFDLFSDLELHWARLDVGEHTTNPAQREKKSL